MDFEHFETYSQRGTGQVFYLWRDDDAETWIIGQSSGFEGIVPVCFCTDETAAREQLAHWDCVARMHEQGCTL
jgi:hypothetical protein